MKKTITESEMHLPAKGTDAYTLEAAMWRVSNGFSKGPYASGTLGHFAVQEDTASRELDALENQEYSRLGI